MSGITKLVEGPFPAFKIFDQGLQGQGLRRAGFEGFPRFEKCTFKGEYPFGEAQLSDSSVPLEVKLTGWNPFIPLDDKNSGIPCVILEYTLHNTSRQPVEYEFSYHLSHLAPGCKPDQSGSANTVIPGKGVFLHNDEEPNAEAFGSASSHGDRQISRASRACGCAARSGSSIALTALWREVSTGTFTANEGSNKIDNVAGMERRFCWKEGWRPVNLVLTPFSSHGTFPIVIVQAGGKPAHADVRGDAGCRSVAGGLPPLWRPYYASIWKDAREVALYVEREYASLRARTVKFKEALFSSTLPPYVLDAVSANLAILKSPTVLREENGNLWGWEGCFPDNGCCEGSCTHVWNYAQAFPHLYPQLERTLRELELVRSMDDRGHVTFAERFPKARSIMTGPLPPTASWAAS